VVNVDVRQHRSGIGVRELEEPWAAKRVTSATSCCLRVRRRLPWALAPAVSRRAIEGGVSSLAQGPRSGRARRWPSRRRAPLASGVKATKPSAFLLGSDLRRTGGPARATANTHARDPHRQRCRGAVLARRWSPARSPRRPQPRGVRPRRRRRDPVFRGGAARAQARRFIRTRFQVGVVTRLAELIGVDAEPLREGFGGGGERGKWWQSRTSTRRARW